MAKCARCGRAIGNAKACPHCGAGPSQSVVNKNVDRVARATGNVLEKGVEVTDKVVKGAAPVVKTVVKESKKGLRLMRDETLRVARSLKEEDK
jgi:hypothetical protein